MNYPNDAAAMISTDLVQKKQVTQQNLSTNEMTFDANESTNMTESVQPNVSVPEKVFKCKHCDATFLAKESLGGHVSRMHPRQSKNYNYKMERRAANRPKHLLHLASKAIA